MHHGIPHLASEAFFKGKKETGNKLFKMPTLQMKAKNPAQSDKKQTSKYVKQKITCSEQKFYLAYVIRFPKYSDLLATICGNKISMHTNQL